MPANDTIEHIIDIEGCNQYEPKAALIVFSKDGYQSDCFIELREIRRDGSMAAAKPVSKQFIQNILSGFSQEYRSIPHGQVPSNLLYCDTRRGHEVYVWYNPPCKRNRFFSESLHIEDGVYNVPGTLYVVQGDEISVYCFAGKKPAPDKPLLGVPYFNVYENGRVCMGSAHPKIPDTDKLSYEDILLAWENAFWNSMDVHTNGSPSTKANLIETIKKYKDKPFDARDIETRKDRLTLNGIINKLK